jgi:hypothetical protein
MNGAQGHMASDPCERLLDYAYGELEGEALEQFKLHLLGCEKCKAELAGLERVRAEVKQAMPMVEPPGERMNAMTAQLLHAAAQNKPKPGKLLAFARRARVVVSHPGYLAAASVILIGGAIGVQWSLGRLTIPADKLPAASETVAAAPAPQAVPPAEPVAAPAAAPEFELKSKDKEAMTVGEKRDDSQVFLDGAKNGRLAVKSAPKAAKVSTGNTNIVNPFGGDEGDSMQQLGRASSGATVAKELAKPEPPKAPAEDRKAAKREAAADEEMAVLSETSAQAPRSRTTADPKGRATLPPPPAVAPPAAPPPQVQAAAPPPAPKAASPITLSTPGYRSTTRPINVAPAKSNYAAPSAGATAPRQQAAASHQNSAGSLAQAQDPRGNVASQQKQATPDALRKQAEALVASGRYEDAVRVYQELERQSAMTMNDRALFVRCLTETKRFEQAEAQRMTLENERAVSTRAKKAGKATNVVDQPPAAAPARASEPRPASAY